MPEFPRPSACHPERCVEFSPDVRLVQQNVGDTLVVECDACATVVTTFPHRRRQAATLVATEHASGHIAKNGEADDA